MTLLKCVCVCVQGCMCLRACVLRIIYVTAAVSQLLSSFPESLFQLLPGYRRAEKVSYCVCVFVGGWASIFIQLQERVVK